MKQFERELNLSRYQLSKDLIDLAVELYKEEFITDELVTDIIEKNLEKLKMIAERF